MHETAPDTVRPLVASLTAGCKLHDSLLIQAIRQNDRARGLQLTGAKETDVGLRGIRQEIALHLAAKLGDVKLVRALLARGADPLQQNAYYRGYLDGEVTPIVVAAYYVHKEVAELLVRPVIALGKPGFIPRPRDRVSHRGLSAIQLAFRFDSHPRELGVEPETDAVLCNLKRKAQNAPDIARLLANEAFGAYGRNRAEFLAGATSMCDAELTVSAHFPHLPAGASL